MYPPHSMINVISPCSNADHDAYDEDKAKDNEKNGSDNSKTDPSTSRLKPAKVNDNESINIIARTKVGMVHGEGISINVILFENHERSPTDDATIVEN